MAASEAAHLAALEKKVRSAAFWPCIASSDLAAAAYVSCRADSSFIAMSAIMNCSPWNSAMRLPNCLRSLT